MSAGHILYNNDHLHREGKILYNHERLAPNKAFYTAVIFCPLVRQFYTTMISYAVKNDFFFKTMIAYTLKKEFYTTRIGNSQMEEFYST